MLGIAAVAGLRGGRGPAGARRPVRRRPTRPGPGRTSRGRSRSGTPTAPTHPRCRRWTNVDHPGLRGVAPRRQRRSPYRCRYDDLHQKLVTAGRRRRIARPRALGHHLGARSSRTSACSCRSTSEMPDFQSVCRPDVPRPAGHQPVRRQLLRPAARHQHPRADVQRRRSRRRRHRRPTRDVRRAHGRRRRASPTATRISSRTTAHRAGTCCPGSGAAEGRSPTTP